MNDEWKNTIAFAVTIVLIAFIVAACSVNEARERTKRFEACTISGAAIETCLLMDREAR